MEKFEPTHSEKSPKEAFHFKEIAEIEPAMTSLVLQLKEKIQNGEYNALLSDDIGGRIPTLVLRKIIKEVRPDIQLQTNFIASGKTYLPDRHRKEDYEKLQEYLGHIASKSKNALLITQFISTGKTIIRLIQALRDAGIDRLDVATVDAMPQPQEESALRAALKEGQLFIGSTDWHHLHESHEKIAGVQKPKKYQPFPKRNADVAATDGRVMSQVEWKKIFDIQEDDSAATLIQKSNDPDRIQEYERRVKEPLTEEEKHEIQKDIVLARQDVSLLAKRVTKHVWGSV